MARNKYTADYRLVEHFDEMGRVKVSYEYIGEPYRFTEPEETVRREKKICLSAAIAGWILFLAALIPYSESMRRLWIALPFAASAVPLFLLTELICAVFCAKEPLERRIHDQLENLYPARLASFMMFSGLAAALSAVRLAIGPERAAGDFLFVSCSALLCAGALCLFRRRKWLKTGRFT